MTNPIHDSGPVTGADDPRLTAYALGELDGESKLAVETWLAQHPEARDDVAALTELGQVLTAELADEPAPELDLARRQAVEAAIEAPAPRVPARPLALRTWVAAAAVVVLGVALGYDVLAPRFRAAVGPDSGAPATADGGDTFAYDEAPFRDRMKAMGYVGDLEDDARGSAISTGRLSALRELGSAEMDAVGGSAAGLDGLADEETLRRARVVLDQDFDPALSTLSDDLRAPSEEQEAQPGALFHFKTGDEAPSQGTPQAGELPDALDSYLLPLQSPEASGSALADGADVGVPSLREDRQVLRAEGAQTAVEVVEIPGAVGGAKKGKGENVSGSPGILTGRGKALARGALAKAPTSPAPESRALVSLGYVGAADGPPADAGRDDDHSRDARSFHRPSGPGESYAKIQENPFVRLSSDPGSALSTFGIDVDTASYTNVRRFLHQRKAPDPDAVRLEELINAFRYDDPAPTGADPLALTIEAADSPWSPGHRIVRLGLKGREIPADQRPPTSLVLLLDVSGSMKSDDKLPLLVHSMELLLESLRDDDRVAIVTYASGSELVLPSTPVSDRDAIVSALRGLHAEGSTHASAGIELAYKVASQAFLDEGNNRVLLATDGDFNVGITDHGELHDLITGKAKSGIFLTVLGFGTGNLKDDTAELLADKGNGNYAYIDGLDEAHRVLVREVQGTLHTIAKDLKLQVEFNPATVQAWRLLGYENRALAATDFRDDTKDAGEVGAGHSLTVLYEVIPVGAELPGGTADLRYHSPPDPASITSLSELLTVNMRWLPPDGGAAVERAFPFEDAGGSFEEASADLRFASAVAAFGMALRGSRYRGDIDLLAVADIAAAAKGADEDGRRAEFVTLARNAKGIVKR